MPMKMKKNNWAVQVLYEIVLSLVIIVPKNLGIQTVVKDISNTEKFLRKKYIGVCRWESTKVRVMMVKFPEILNIYVMTKKRKITIWISGSSDSPRRMNSEGTVRFLIADPSPCFTTENMFPLQNIKKVKTGLRIEYEILKISMMINNLWNSKTRFPSATLSNFHHHTFK